LPHYARHARRTRDPANTDCAIDHSVRLRQELGAIGGIQNQVCTRAFQLPAFQSDRAGVLPRQFRDSCLVISNDASRQKSDSGNCKN
jgi:hypothetical protein